MENAKRTLAVSITRKDIELSNNSLERTLKRAIDRISGYRFIELNDWDLLVYSEAEKSDILMKMSDELLDWAKAYQNYNGKVNPIKTLIYQEAPKVTFRF